MKWRDWVVPAPNSLFSPADRSKASKAGADFLRAPTWVRKSSQVKVALPADQVMNGLAARYVVRSASERPAR